MFVMPLGGTQLSSPVTVFRHRGLPVVCGVRNGERHKCMVDRVPRQERESKTGARRVDHCLMQMLN